MKIGILGIGPVGRSFLEVLSGYDHQLYAFDTNPDRTQGLDTNVRICRSEEDVGYESDFLLCCTDMLSGYALTKAAKAMKPEGVVSGDFSAKTPEYKAVKASGRLERGDLAYWSIHGLSAPGMGFKNQLIVEIPVYRCKNHDGTEHPYIVKFRGALKAAGARFKRIWSVKDHDRRMGRIQGSIVENICTARTLAELGINPLEADGIYQNELDRIKFLMALRSIGQKGSSNPTVYGLIEMMNPYSLENVRKYRMALETLIKAVETGESEALLLLEEAEEALGHERVAEAERRWKGAFGELRDSGNSFSSQLAEAMYWAESEYPLDIFEETPSPPYEIRALMALVALGRHSQCVRNMRRGDTQDRDFLKFVRMFEKWAEASAADGDWDSIREFEDIFFEPARAAFSKELRDIGPRTNELIRRLR